MISWNSVQRLDKVATTVKKRENSEKVKAIHLHLFADASFTACSAVTTAVIEHSSGIAKGLLTSKSRISKRNTSAGIS